MAIERVFNGIDAMAYLNPQSALGTVATDYTGTDAIAFVKATASEGKPFSLAEKRGLGFGRANCTVEEREEPTWSIEGQCPASGSLNGTNDWSLFLAASGLLTKTTGGNTAVSGSGSTTTVVDVTSAASLTANLSVVDISGELRLVTATDTVSTPDNITVSPALSSAPADLVVVSVVESFTPSRVAHNSVVGSTGHIISGGGHQWTILRDMIVGKISGEVGLAGALMLTVEGIASTADYGLYDTASGTIADSATSWGLNSGNIPVDSALQEEGGTETGAIVTAGSKTTTLTVSRGSNPDAYTSGDAMLAYMPAVTVQTTHIPAIQGTAIVGGVSISDAAVTFEWDFAPVKGQRRGSVKSFDVVSPGPTTCNIKVTGVADRATFRALQEDGYGQAAGIVVFAQFGTVSGASAMVYLPHGIAIERPEMVADGGDMVQYEVTFEGLGHNDMIVLALP